MLTTEQLLKAAWECESPGLVTTPTKLAQSFWGRMLSRILTWERSGASEAEIQAEIILAKEQWEEYWFDLKSKQAPAKTDRQVQKILGSQILGEISFD